jgi:hypothetical protein
VLQNARKHGCGVRGIDPYTSGPWFDGWKDVVAVDTGPTQRVVPVVPARSWLLKDGWRRHGLIELLESPAGVLRPTRRRVVRE